MMEKVYELRASCLDAIDRGQEFITLFTKSTRLCGKRGPVGELRGDTSDGYKIVAFKPEKVLAFIDRELSR